MEQALTIQLLGYSKFAARLPAAVAVLLALAGMPVLARQAGLRRPWLAMLLFTSFPLVLRYGAEARPYSQGLCIAVWLHVLFLEITNRSGRRLFPLYSLLLLVGLYTQPYVLFVAVTHTAFLALRSRWSLVWVFLAMMAATGALYLPWYFHSRGFWREEVEASQLHFHLQAKLALLIFREVLGSGYIGTIFVVILSCLGLSYLRQRRGGRLFWVVSILLPLALVVFADLLFDYFFAIRQVILILPPLAITSSAGIELLWERKGTRVAAGCIALLVALDLAYAVRWFTKPAENWALAAATLKRSVASGCFIALPPGSAHYYEFFQPELAAHECTSLDSFREPRVVLAIGPYLIQTQQEKKIETNLRASHYRLTTITPGQPELRFYEK